MSEHDKDYYEYSREPDDLLLFFILGHHVDGIPSY